MDALTWYSMIYWANEPLIRSGSQGSAVFVGAATLDQQMASVDGSHQAVSTNYYLSERSAACLLSRSCETMTTLRWISSPHRRGVVIAEGALLLCESR